MRWTNCILLREAEKHEDELGNIITTYEPCRKIKARLTEWTAEDIQKYGREITDYSRKVLTTYKNISLDNRINIEGIEYEIKQIKDLGRFYFLLVGEIEIWQ